MYHVRWTSVTCPQGIEIELALERLFLAPIMIAVAFITPAFGSRLHRPSLFMTSAAGFNSGQIDLSRLSALQDTRVARLAGHHAMGGAIEFRVKKPASRNYRLDGGREVVAFSGCLAVAFFAIFSPQHPFGNLGALLCPVRGRCRRPTSTTPHSSNTLSVA